MDREIKKRHPLLLKAAFIGIPALALAGAAWWALSGAFTSVYHADRAAVLYGEVTSGSFNDYIRLSGRVETGTVVQVSALETGIVERKWVEEGAFVNAGDIILTVSNSTLRQQILDSESQLAERQNMLRDTELAMEKERLQLRQDLLTARMETGRLKREADRQKTLYEERLTSREEYLKACEDYELAREKMKLLDERIVKDSVYRSIQIGMMRESLDNMHSNLMLVRQRADNLNIRVSHSGQLGALDAELGQNIQAGQRVGQINILGDYRIVTGIDEHYIDRVAPGLSGTVERNGAGYDVSIRKVYPEVNAGQFRADLVFTGVVPDKIRVGQTFHVDLRLGDPVEAVMVPRGSFFQTSGGHWAYVVAEDGKSAVRREIAIGRQNPRYYEVVSGLKPGERIITSSYADYGEADRIEFDD